MNAFSQDIQTKPQLLARLKSSATRRPTQEERLEQRISFVYGSMGLHSNATKELVRRVVMEQQGGVTEVSA